jgi:2-methylcitrate dehydratase PrpD
VLTTRPTTVTAELAEFLIATGFAEMPAEVLHTGKRVLLDLIGCGLASAREEDLVTLHRGVRRYDRGDDATVWGTDLRASVPMAALINATAAHARELDDAGGPGHVGTVIIPTALAMGETCHSDGREVLTAIVHGYEVLHRIADGAGGYGPIVEPGWHPIGVTGNFGGAAVAGKLLGLNHEQLTSALGLAGSYSGGSFAFIADGSMSKRWHPGRCAANGIEAAYLAAEGFAGPTQILEAPWGNFYAVHFPKSEPRLEAVTAGLGSEWRMMDVGFKVHACCRGIHTYFEALQRLMAEHRLTADQIDTIEVDANQVNANMLGKREIGTVLDAQMSMSYSLAVGAYTGKLSLEEYTPRWLEDPAVNRLAERVRIVVDPSIARGASRSVRVRLVDGRQLSTLTEEPIGSASKPLSDTDLSEKFQGLVVPAVGERRARAIEQAIWSFDELTDAAEFCRLLVG